MFPIAMRHDIDTKTGVNYLPKMIEIEGAAGIRSTIHIRIDCITNYNYLLELQDDGWEFGLHVSSDIAMVIHYQLRYLRELGFKIQGASMCGSPDFIGKGWGWLDLKKNYQDWLVMDGLGLDYICGFGEVPLDIKTTVFENGAFTLDNFYVANYGRKAMDHLLSDMKLYYELVDPPVYPLLVHPINLFRPVSSNPFPAFLFKHKLYRYAWKGSHMVFGIKSSIKLFKKVVKKFAPSIFRYKDVLPLLPTTNRGFVNSVLSYRVYSDFIPFVLRRKMYEIR